MAKAWYYYNNDGRKCGPISSVQLKSLADQGVVTPATRIANEEGKEAVAEKVKGLFSPSATPAPPPPRPIPPPPPPKAKPSPPPVSPPPNPFDAFPPAEPSGNAFDTFPMLQSSDDPFGNIPLAVAPGSYAPFPSNTATVRRSSSGIGYFDVLKKYADFSGRARRKEYWMFYFVNWLIYIAFVVFCFTVGAVIGAVYGPGEETIRFAETVGSILGGLYLLWNLGILLPTLAVLIRRLHDAGHSGWWLLIIFVPLVGLVILLVFLIQDSQQESNKYGPRPK
jgi:uncharacterized membrane protein YhaH (DUF805 family)